MSSRKKALKRVVKGPRARSGRSRQRQRLIEACISALHIHGPSRTTVEKVVAIAKMSRGIVRFYFDTKAAMLIASLQFLSAEFDEQVLGPVAALKTRPVAALQLMVDLYLDPEIASPRKVSVWYAFWGEASSRQEYYDICGQKDESSAALMRELIETLIEQTAQPHLDADGIALGLIGALEILWQDIAFQTERDIDRPAAKRRCMAYLRSVFPGSFAEKSPPIERISHLPRWAYADSSLWAMERDTLFQPAWIVVGHESQLPHNGDFITVDTGVERVLLVRDETGVLHACRNSCPEYPHALVGDREGHFDGFITCPIHRLRFSLAGIGLKALDFKAVGGLLWTRAALGRPGNDVSLEIETSAGLMMLAPAKETTVVADWKLLVEQWLGAASREAIPDEFSTSIIWDAPPANPNDWSARRYVKIMACVPEHPWRRQFIAPHQLLEARPDGLSILQALSTAPGQSLLRRLDYTALPPDDSARASLYLARRLGRLTRRSMLGMAESAQRGMTNFGYDLPQSDETAPAVAWFRALLGARLPALQREWAPGGR